MIESRNYAPNPTKIVVQASGGIDSTVLLAMAVAKVGRDNVYPIAFDTDSIFWRNRDSIAVKRVCTNLQLHQNLFVCRMPQFDFLEYTRDSDYTDVGFIPGMKLLFNTASLAFAQRVGAAEVWIGNMHDNVFPDETEDHLSDTTRLYNDTYTVGEGMPRVALKTPLFHMSKAEVITLGTALECNIWDTVSCGDERLSGGFNCGVCPWCVKRIAGFNAAGVNDHTRYVFVPYVGNEWAAQEDWRNANTRAAKGLATTGIDHHAARGQAK